MPDIAYEWSFTEIYGYNSVAAFITSLPGWAQPLAKISSTAVGGYFVVFYPEESR